jgi:hypothetical protein
MLLRSLVYLACFIATFNPCYGGCLHRFSLPLFDGYGTKICDIFGRRADLSDEKNLKIFDILIQISSKQGADPSKKICVRSDRANVNPMENIASGDGFIAISSDEFSATGSDWRFSGNAKNFTLNKNAQVFFKKIQVNGP